MNVFVLSTGRTGSLSLEKACRNMTNYTVGHETRCQLTGNERINFPDNHIEIDNRLSWFLGRLDEKYGKDAFYVHMVREPEQTAASYRKRWHRETSIVRAYAYGILKRQEHELNDMDLISLDYVNCVNENIRSFLKDKPHQIVFNLKDGERDLLKFWKAIHADGDHEKAIIDFGKRHNDSFENEKRHNNLTNKVLRIIKKFPSFMKNA